MTNSIYFKQYEGYTNEYINVYKKNYTVFSKHYNRVIINNNHYIAFEEGFIKLLEYVK